MAPYGISPLSQFAAKCHNPPVNWEVIDNEFRSFISPLHSCLNNNNLHTSEASKECHGVLRRRGQPCTKGPHKERAIVKLTQRQGKEKIKLGQALGLVHRVFFMVHVLIIKLSRPLISPLSNVVLDVKKESLDQILGLPQSLCVILSSSTLPSFNQSVCQTYLLKFSRRKVVHVNT